MTPTEIISAFAATEPLYYDEYGDTCLYCDYGLKRHTQECPWRGAREVLGLEVPEPKPVEPPRVPTEYERMLAKIWAPLALSTLKLNQPFIAEVIRVSELRSDDE